MSKYPFDHTASLPENKITNELHTIQSANAIDCYLLAPNATPFYGETMAVVDELGNTLDEGTDYYLTHYWAQASDHTGHPVYGSLVLTDPNRIGNFKLNYQTIGGEFVDAPYTIITDGLIVLSDIYGLNANVVWTTIPTSFPSNPHTAHLTSLNGMTQILAELEKIIVAWRQPPAAISVSDIHGFNSEFITPVITQLANIAVAINSRVNYDSVLTTILNKLQVVCPTLIFDSNLDVYNFNTSGNLKERIISFTYNSGNEPTVISLTPPFTSKCLWVDAKVYNINGSIEDNVVLVSQPSITGFNISIKYNSPPIPNSQYNLVIKAEGY
jgi:hypothetical protein